MILLQRSVLALTLLCTALLSGCVTQPKTLYQWEDYQTEVYSYLKGDGEGIEDQIAELEKDLQKIHTQGNLPPPGYHAHLGLLYLKKGNIDQMAAQFQTEKTHFPESVTFMDFLLKQDKSTKKKPEINLEVGQ